MSKRDAPSPLSRFSTKKAKSESKDVWGDDLDENLIEDCFIRASQVCNAEEQNNGNHCDVSVLPSYSFFQPRSNLFTSTQLDNNISIQDKLKTLQEKYAEKEGEVAILRTNLQKLRSSHQEEQEKKDKEWKDRVVAIQKQSKAYKSELEFKNLEIVNLKQQTNEISRLMNVTEHNSPQNKIAESSKCINFPKLNLINSDSNFCIYINSISEYPLKELNFSYVFEENIEDKSIHTNHREGSTVGLNIVFPEITYLTSLTKIQLDSDMATSALNKIICVTLHLLNLFLKDLKKLENTIQLQDIQEADCLYLQNASDPHLNEMGTDVGKLLGFLSEIILFNSFVRGYLTKEKCLEKVTDTSVTLLQDSHLLDLILNIITLVGRIRMENVSSVFLFHVFSFLSKLFLCGDYFGTHVIKEIVYEISDQLLFLRLASHIIPKLTEFLRIASKNVKFVNLLCTGKVQKLDGPIKNVLYFKRDSCRFHMFAVLLGNLIKHRDILQHKIQLSKDIIEFACNLMKSNAVWLYHTDIKKCSCLSQLYKMVITTIYKDLQNLESNKAEDEAQNMISKRYVQILHVLCSNSLDLTMKYVIDLSRFKEITHILSEILQEVDVEDSNVLDGLNATEEFLDISLNEFQNVTL